MITVFVVREVLIGMHEGVPKPQENTHKQLSFYFLVSFLFRRKANISMGLWEHKIGGAPPT
jgi:hypothetical protein